MDCPVCRCSCRSRRPLTLRGRVFFSFFGRWDHIFDVAGQVICRPINSFQRCRRRWNRFQDDRRYRPPTARQFLSAQNKMKRFNQVEVEKRAIECLNGHEILLKPQEPVAIVREHAISNLQQVRQITNVYN